MGPLTGSETPTAGARGQEYPQPLEGDVDPELAQQRVSLQLLDRGNRPQGHLGRRLVGRPRPVRQRRELLRGPALQRRVDGLSARLQILGDGLRVPALDVEADDRQPALGRVGGGVVEREAPVGLRWRRVFGEDALDGVGAGAMPIAGPPDCRDLMHVERRVLPFGIEDRLADLSGKQAVLRDLRWGRRPAMPSWSKRATWR